MRQRCTEIPHFSTPLLLSGETRVLRPGSLVRIQECDEERVESVGATAGGRILVVVFTWRGEAIRPITAYAAPVRIQKLYLKGERV